MSGSITDSDLVKSLKRGSTSALEKLFFRYYSIVLQFIKSIVKRNDIAEDLSMEVFMKLWLFRDRLDEQKSLRNYLFVLSKNSSINYLESALAKHTKTVPELPEESKLSLSADDDLIYNETNRQLFGIIARMPEQRQLVFRMSRYENLSNQEIAEKLGLSVRTVEKHLQLALRDIRTSLN
ncbi:MAG: RNA polymerase sigma-70 factor [Bacteroidales bacterium]|nr:RNA polymerase sigma-70 factor [Bacteroidales bacterium]